MKKLLAFLLLLVAAAGGSTYWSSLETERRFSAVVSSHSLGDATEVELTYQRGFLRSRATERIPLHFGSSVALVAEHQITHGPIPWGLLAQGDYDLRPTLAHVQSTVRLDVAEVSESLRTVLASLQPMITVRLAFRGSQQADVQLPATQLALADGGALQFDALQGTVESPADFSKSSGSFTWPSVSFQGSEGWRLALQELSYDFQYDDLATAGQAFSPGLENFRVDSVQFQAESTPPVQLNGFAATSKASRDGGFAQMASDLRFTHLTAGPVALVGGTSLDISGRLSEGAVSAWRQAIPRLVELGQTGDIAAIGDFYRELLPLLSESSQSLALQSDIPGQGELRVAAQLHWGTLDEPVLDSHALLEVLDADLIVRLPNRALALALLTGFVEAGNEGRNGDPKAAAGETSTPSGVNAAVSAGLRRFFVEDRDGSYQFHGTFKEGVLTINGVSSDVIGRLRDRGPDREAAPERPEQTSPPTEAL